MGRILVLLQKDTGNELRRTAYVRESARSAEENRKRDKHV